MARIPLNNESHKDSDGRIIRESKVTQNRRKSNADLGPANLDQGTAWGEAGSLSLPSFQAKRQQESDESDDYLEEKALEASQGAFLSPSSQTGQTTSLSQSPAKSAGNGQSDDLPRRSAPANAMIGQTVERETVKRLPSILNATQKFFNDLDAGDKKATDHFLKHWLTPDAMKETEKSNAKMLAEHIDFQQYRIFKRGHFYQQQLMLTKTQRTYGMAGRRSGKTEGAEMIAENELVVPEHRVLLIGLTYETAANLYWHKIIKGLEDLDIPVAEKKSQDGTLRLANGSFLKITGNSTSDEREKLRGGKWHAIIIDEAQSQKALPYLVRDILEPMLLDYKGKLYIFGTGPRVRGTFWEKVWTDDIGATRINWNLTQNPFIPDHDLVLAKIREEKGLSVNDPLYLREYLGKIAYDDDALVLRFKENNYYENSDFTQWLVGLPRTDIRFVGGLDYGFADSDAFVILCYAESRPEVFMVYQHKAAREGLEQLKAGIQNGLDYLKSDPLFQSIPEDIRSDIYIYADSSDGRASADLSSALHLNIFPAWKHDKQAGVDMLQDDVRRGYLKIPKIDGGMSPIEDEGMKTVFLRNDNDQLTRELDDDTYHPDVIPATIYAARSGPWMFRDRK